MNNIDTTVRLFYEENKQYLKPYKIRHMDLIDPLQDLIDHATNNNLSYRDDETIFNNCKLGYNAELALIELTKNSLVLNNNKKTDYKYTYAWDLLDTKTGLRIEVKSYSGTKEWINLYALNKEKFPDLICKSNYYIKSSNNIENALQDDTADIIIFININNFISGGFNWYTFTPTFVINADYGIIKPLLIKSKKTNGSKYINLHKLSKEPQKNYNVDDENRNIEGLIGHYQLL